MAKFLGRTISFGRNSLEARLSPDDTLWFAPVLPIVVNRFLQIKI
jgi:hypothetical protein